VSVRVENLTVRFEDLHSPPVNAVSFEAPARAITALLGPSGAGKSTVLRLVAGLERPDEGRIFLSGRDVTGLRPAARRCGFVFQNYALFPHLTVRENVAFGLEVRHAPRREVRARVDALLEKVQLTRLADRLPRQLSGGERQRTAFARALAVEPDVLLLDEPFGALDAGVRRELRDWLARLHDEIHLTTLLVTHDRDEALELAEHVVIMMEGKVVQTGSPTEVWDHPNDERVAALLGLGTLVDASVRAGEARVGGLPVAAVRAEEGDRLVALLRPRDVHLARASDTTTVPVSRVERLRRIAGRVRVLLRLPAGEPLTLDASPEEVDALGIREGDAVTVDLRGAQLFPASR
jgi:sulfate transport system ATP-binding protein